MFMAFLRICTWGHRKILEIDRYTHATVIQHKFCSADIRTRIVKWHWFTSWNYTYHNRNCDVNTGMRTTWFNLNRDGATYDLVSLWMGWCSFCIMTSSNGNISELLSLCAENPLVIGEFPPQRKVRWTFDASLLSVWTNCWTLDWLLIPAWISNYIHYNVWGEITYPFLNFNGATVEV